MHGPHAAAEIIASLRALHDESVGYWSTFDTPAFFAPLGSAWSPADNVRHLTKTMRAINRGLNAPKWLLWLRFGRGQTSRNYTEMKAVYLARLARGASAGPFTPAPISETTEAERGRIMESHADAIEQLTTSLGRWSERALDWHRLPHPLLGPITVREMLFFALYHNRHHLEGVQRRAADR